jgi:tRNA (guanine-N7-)-methyltransferase
MPGARPHARTFYGRIRGKALRPNQQRLLAELLPTVAVPGVGRAGAGDRTPIDPAALFGPGRPVWLEIGFGGGEHMVHTAASHPEVGLIGCEPFVNGVAMALARIETTGVTNLRLHAGDARDLIDLLPDASLARVFLLYPDPWPKTRHRARRFMNPENLAALARIMQPGAALRLATDIPDYAAHARAAVAALGAGGGFALRGGPTDWARPWPGWPGTRYEAKALRAGRSPQYLSFLRTGAAAVDGDRPIA